LHKDLASSREDAENRDLAGGATTTFAFAPAAKIGLIKLYFLNP
jgi:hypothetical protein